MYLIEYLKFLELLSLSHTKLHVKVGCPNLLLQNIVPKRGLCNGSRLTVTRLSNCIVETQILTGSMWEKLHSFQESLCNQQH
jgi:hypothetical protein